MKLFLYLVNPAQKATLYLSLEDVSKFTVCSLLQSVPYTSVDLYSLNHKKQKNKIK